MRENEANVRNIIRGKILILGITIFVIFLGLIIRLFVIQIVEVTAWTETADAVSSRSEALIAQRGTIWDRNVDKPIASNSESYTIRVVPAEISPSVPEELAADLATIIGSSKEAILDRIPPDWITNWNTIEISDGVSYEMIIMLAESKENFSGISWISEPKRQYNSVGSISHISGYVGDITVDELQVLYNQGYNGSASLGKSGIEKEYDGVLRGNNGRLYRTVDVKGRNLGGDGGVVPPENGLDIVLTIDSGIQELAEKALGPRNGSLIVLKPSTGEILAMVSYPSFDPNKFAELGVSNFNNLSLNNEFPFLNRSIQSSYPPASTFKLIMTAAILGEQAIDPEAIVVCNGVITVGNRKFWCWKKSGHGPVNLKRALEISCNIYFGTLGLEYLGINVISEYAQIFGLGTPTGIELDGEVDGDVPSRSWKEQLFNSPWTGGDTLNTSIGQGFLTTTPLQMANVLAAIVNEGTVYRPRLLKEIRQHETGQIIEETEPEILRKIDKLSTADYEFIKDAMRGVITEGTGVWAIYTDAVKIAGKTGTGEIGADDRWHDWFVAYGPYDTTDVEEQIVVVTMIEAADSYDWWAPKATDIVFEGIFGKRTYEEVIDEWRMRGVWWSWDNMDLPEPGVPFERIESERD